MKAAPALKVVDTSELQVYPINSRERLESHYFVAFHFNRWLNSAFRLTASAEVRAYGLDLFFLSQNQTPVGTLPDDDRQLAALLNLDLAAWQDLKAREISPLYKWSRCLCGTEVRLHHPVVTELAEDALDQKRRKIGDLEKGRARKRLAALGHQIRAAGGTQAMADDDALKERLDGWLLQHCDGNRTPSWVRKALEADANHAI